MGAEEYRRNARRCVELAHEMIDPTHSAKLIDLAASWIRLAEEAEKNSEADPTNKLPPPTTDQLSPSPNSNSKSRPRKRATRNRPPHLPISSGGKPHYFTEHDGSPVRGRHP